MLFITKTDGTDIFRSDIILEPIRFGLVFIKIWISVFRTPLFIR